jgi:hypothetical protein
MSDYILEEAHNWAVSDAVLIVEEIARVACSACVVVSDAICASFLANHTSPGCSIWISSHYRCTVCGASTCCCIKEVCWGTLFTFCCRVTAFTVRIASIAIVCGVIKEKSFKASVLSKVASISNKHEYFMASETII